MINFKKICAIASAIMSIGSIASINASAVYSSSYSDTILQQAQIEAKDKFEWFRNKANSIISDREYYRTRLDEIYALSLANPAYSSRGEKASLLNQINQNEIKEIRDMISRFAERLNSSWYSTSSLNSLCDDLKRKRSIIQDDFKKFKIDISKVL